MGEHVALRASDSIKHKNIFEVAISKYLLRVDELEIDCSASDQNWGNTGHDHVYLTIKKGKEQDKDPKYRLFTINHNEHPGFYTYSVKYSMDGKDKTILDAINAGNMLIVTAHCAPYPGWQLKMKHAKISIVYQE